VTNGGVTYEYMNIEALEPNFVNISPTYISMFTIEIRSSKIICKEFQDTSILSLGSIVQKEGS